LALEAVEQFGRAESARRRVDEDLEQFVFGLLQLAACGDVDRVMLESQMRRKESTLPSRVLTSCFPAAR
jgi:hypothetical protein